MDVNARKSPRQNRAKATMDAIVEATAQLLVEEGYERITTARIAIRAGVSVGSLYQYFPNKAALASAVIDQCCDDFVEAFNHALARPGRKTLVDSVNAIITLLASRHISPELHRVVNELAPQIGVGDKTDRVSQTTTALIVGVLAEHSDELSPGIDIEVAARIILTSLEAIAHRILLAESSKRQIDRYSNQARRMIVRYLRDG